MINFVSVIEEERGSLKRNGATLLFFSFILKDFHFVIAKVNVTRRPPQVVKL